jgi:hypothetical protein
MAVQSRSFGLPNPGKPSRKLEGSQYVSRTLYAGVPQVAPPLPFVQAQPRRKDRYVEDASRYISVNRLTNEAPEVIHRFFETPPPKKRPYTVAISLVRGQAGAAGVTPPDTGQRFYPFWSRQDKRTAEFYPPASNYMQMPMPLRLEYDPFGGGAFFGTPSRSASERRRYNVDPFIRPQILLPEADLPLRHWVDIGYRPKGRDYNAPGSSFALRQLQNLVPLPEEISKFWPTAPRYRPAGPTYLVDGGHVRPLPATQNPNSSGGYDIYHYYT